MSKNKLAKFIVIYPESSQGKQTINLIKDADGRLVEGNALGTIVEVKASVGHALALPELIHVDEIVEVVRG